MIAAIDANDIQPIIDSTFPLDQIEAAFRHQISQRHFGEDLPCIVISDIRQKIRRRADAVSRNEALTTSLPTHPALDANDRYGRSIASAPHSESTAGSPSHPR